MRLHTKKKKDCLLSGRGYLAGLLMTNIMTDDSDILKLLKVNILLERKFGAEVCGNNEHTLLSVGRLKTRWTIPSPCGGG